MSHTITLSDAEKVPSHGRRSERLVYDLDLMLNVLAHYPSLLAECGRQQYDLAWEEMLLCIWAIQAERAAMEIVRRREHQRKIQPHAKLPGRNDPCPCGSGHKWKACHGRNA